MPEEMRVKYLFMSWKYSNYVRLQAALVVALLVFSGLAFVSLRDSGNWLYANAWWLLVIAALLEVGESWLAIRKAKKERATIG